MKKLFLNFFAGILLSICYLSNGIAENHTGWNLPDGAIARIGKGEIENIQYSPDGTQFAVATSVGIWIYDTKTYKELKLIKENALIDYKSRNISFSPDGSTLATIKGGKSGIILFDTVSGISTKTFMKQFGSFGITTVLFSPDGKTLATDDYRRLLLWDVVTGKNKKLEELTDSIGGIAFSPDGQTLASGSKDQTIRLWNVATGSLKHTLKGHTGFVTSVSFSPDGRTLASGSVDSSIRLWDTETGTHVKTFTEAKVNVSQISFSPDGQDILSWGKGDSKIILWDVKTGEYKLVDNLQRKRIGVRFSPDGNTIAAASQDHTIDFFDGATRKHKKRIIGDTFKDLTFFMGEFADLTLSPDGTKFIMVNIDKSINLCDIETGQCKLLTTHTSEDENRYLHEFLFSSDSRKFAGMYSDGLIRLWDANTGKELYVFKSKHLSKNKNASKESFHLYTSALGLAFSPDSLILASASLDNSIHVWATTTGILKRSLKGHTGKIESLLFSADGKTLVSGSQDGTLRLWNTATGKLKQTMTNRLFSKPQTSDPIAISTISFNPKGDLIASGNHDGSIVLWEVATGQQKGTFLGHIDSISNISFSPDEQEIVSTSMDGSVRLWEVATGQQKFAVAGYRLTDWKVFFYPDGLPLASNTKRGAGMSGEPNINLWDLEKGKRIKILTGHNGEVTSIAFSADGQTLISGSKDGTVLVWDIPNIVQEIDSPE